MCVRVCARDECGVHTHPSSERKASALAVSKRDKASDGTLTNLTELIHCGATHALVTHAHTIYLCRFFEIVRRIRIRTETGACVPHSSNTPPI
jgi:hypothetical protein